MLLVGCSGFPVPPTKYLKEFPLVEVADTLLGVPGPAQVRRWKREAPTGFFFTALAPKALTADGCKPSAAAEEAWEQFLPVAREVDARAVVITTPPEFAYGKTQRAAVHALLARLSEKTPAQLVWEPPASWDLREAEATVKELSVLVARDPARHPPFQKVKLAYYRLPGPAGHRSRYEDPPLEIAAKTLRETIAEDTWVFFANVDMHADAKRLRKLVG